MKLFLGFSLIAIASASAQEKDEKAVEEPIDPDIVFTAGFQGEGVKAGNSPSSFEIESGKWEIVELRDGRPLLPTDKPLPSPISKEKPKDGEKVEEPKEPTGIAEGAYQALGEPIVDSEVRIGPFLRDQGSKITARVRAENGNGISPRFGLALHSPIGYRLRVVPAKDQIELQKGGGNEEPPVQTTSFEWRDGEWWFLELIVMKSGDNGAWTVEGRVWPESGERPVKAPLEYIATDGMLGGKAALLATPYSSRPILFDDIEVKKISIDE